MDRLFGRRKSPEEMLRQNQRALTKVGQDIHVPATHIGRERGRVRERERKRGGGGREGERVRERERGGR